MYMYMGVFLQNTCTECIRLLVSISRVSYVNTVAMGIFPCQQEVCGVQLVIKAQPVFLHPEQLQVCYNSKTQ